VAGRGSMYLTTSGIHRQEAGRVIHLYPVFYVKGLTHKYLSVSALLNLGLKLRGSSTKLEFRTHKYNRLEFLCEPHELGQNLYWLSAMLVRADSLLASTMVSLTTTLCIGTLPIHLWMFCDMHQETHRVSLIY
jgi:hypothetical protein